MATVLSGRRVGTGSEGFHFRMGIGSFNLGIDSHRLAEVDGTPPDGLSSGVLPTDIDRSRLLDVRLG
jgi:hypothetical protein